MLYDKTHRIDENICVKIPTVGEIVKDEDDYYGTVSLIVSTPYNMMVQLDEIGIDFTSINEWELFCMLFPELQKRDTSKVFVDLNLEDFDIAVNSQNGDVVLLNENTGAIIDQKTHHILCKYLCKMLYLERENKKPANEEAKEYMLERAKKKLKRQQKRQKNSNVSQLEKHIIALVNTSEFPYNYETVLDITIHQFYASLHQVIRKVRYDKVMIGCYAGTVNMKELNIDELYWISS